MLKLFSLFTDHAILQCGKTIAVWGKSEPYALLEGKLAGKTCRCRANDTGDFMFSFPPMEPGISCDLSIRDLQTGETAHAADLLTGELWLASGQSNMACELWRFPDAQEMIDSAHNDNIRMFRVPHRAQFGPQKTAESSWEKDTGNQIGHWSAAALHFARKLHAELRVPVGILSASIGGSIAQAWTSREKLLQNPDFRDHLLELEAKYSTVKYWEHVTPRQMKINPDYWMPDDVFEASLPKEIFENAGEKQKWHLPETDDSSWTERPVPAKWADYDFVDNGSIWYRKKIRIPDAWLGKELTVSLGGIDKQDITYFNGREIGRMGSRLEYIYWDVCRIYQIPAELNTRSSAVIAVRDFSFMLGGGMHGPENTLYIMPSDDPSQKLSLCGNWKMKEELVFESLRPTFSGIGHANEYAMLFNNMIHPLIPVSLRGVIWYQGCSNAPDGTYQRLLTDLIADWRFRFGQGDFPFIQVLLAGFHEEKLFDGTALWPYLREAQSNAARLTGNLCASAVDAGEVNDIHPKDKKTVGTRLALAALEECYHKIETGCGPRLVSVRKEKDKLLLSFDHAGKGLCAKDDAPLCGFTAEIKGKYVPVPARIVSPDQLEILLPSGAEMIYYAWADNPNKANLCNSEGLPAEPFRKNL